MDVKEAWRVWITYVGTGGQLSGIEEGSQLEQAKLALFQLRVTAELWEAVA